MSHWWDENIDGTGRQPLLVLLVAFVVTFLVVRLITRLIRAGKSPLGNVSAGGLHVHHVVPGIILLFVGATLAVADIEFRGAGYVAAVLVGVGGALVFDEFALVLHLDDVYWSEDGRKSVEAVTLFGALMLAVLLGLSPFGVEDVQAGELRLRLGSMAHFLVASVLALLCLAKGKLRTAVWAVFLVPVGLVAAVRLARPRSWWARRFYAENPAKQARAEARLVANEARWGRLRRQAQDALAGFDEDQPSAPVDDVVATSVDDPPRRLPG